MDFKFTDNSDEYKAALNEAAERALTIIGEMGSGDAKLELRGKIKLARSNELVNSIDSKVVMNEKAVYIGSTQDYAPYVEVGTGIYTSGGRRTRWTYYDEYLGSFFKTYGQEPKHFLKNGLEKNEARYKEVIKEELKG